MSVYLEEPKIQTMLVTIGAFRHPRRPTSRPYNASLPRRGSARYPNKKAKKKKIEITRDLFPLAIMLRALSCFFFPSVQLPYDTTTAATATRTAKKVIGLFVTARLQRESASFHVLSRTGTQDNNFLFLFLHFDAVL